MTIEKEFQLLDENESMNSLSFEELEKKLQEELEEQLSDLKFLEEEKEKIGNPDNLGQVVANTVWEQFMNQIAIVAGEDFIEENRGLNLDLRKEAHIQTTENFAEGKIATHNTEIDYQQRYDDWQSNFQKDPNIEHKTSNYRYNEEQQVWEKHDTRSDSWKKVLNKDARADFDKDRPKGNNTANTNMDHTVSAGEIIRDPAANAHMTREEQVAFANSEKNLNLMDSAANQSKGDSTMSEFLDSERDGKRPAERFNIDEEELRKKDAEAREEYEKQKKEAEKKSVAAGKQSQKEEAFRIGGKALRSAVMGLLMALLREVMQKLIQWLKSAQKSIETLLEHIKKAVQNFVKNLKKYIVNAGESTLTTIFYSIYGSVVRKVKKVLILLKQGWKSLKEAVAYLKDPANQDRPFDIKIMEVGKIIIAGASAASAMALGEAIEVGLSAIPFMAVEIPLLGSLANIIGIFMGGLVAGLIGAIAINMIDKAVAKRQKQEVLEKRIEKANEVIATQTQLIQITEQQLIMKQEDVFDSISERHESMAHEFEKSLNNIFNEEKNEVITGREEEFDELEELLRHC